MKWFAHIMMSRLVKGALSALLLAPAAGCMVAGHASMASMSSGEQHGAGEHAGSGADICPVHVLGTTVEVADTPEGVALLFVTRGGNVAELRNRVRHLAKMHGRPDDSSMGGDHQAKQHGMMSGMMMSHQGDHGSTNAAPSPGIAARAAVEDIPDGARLTLAPLAPTPLEALRSHVHQHAQAMQRGECPPMSMDSQPGAAPGPIEPQGHRHGE